MPEIWKDNPEIKLTLLGSNPPESLLKYETDNVLIPGFIDDVSDYFHSSRLFVCPLRYGAGMKGKIGQSLEFKLPIVSTSYGVEGMELVENENYLLGQNTNAFIVQIKKLYFDNDLWYKLHNNSEIVLKKYSPNTVKDKIEEILAISR